MHDLIDCSPLIGGVLNFLASAIRVIVYVKISRLRSSGDPKINDTKIVSG